MAFFLYEKHRQFRIRYEGEKKNPAPDAFPSADFFKLFRFAVDVPGIIESVGIK